MNVNSLLHAEYYLIYTNKENEFHFEFPTNFATEQTDLLKETDGGDSDKERYPQANFECLDLVHVENISVTIDMADGIKLKTISVYRLLSGNGIIIVGGDMKSKKSVWNSRVINVKKTALLSHSLQNVYVVAALGSGQNINFLELDGW